MTQSWDAFPTAPAAPSQPVIPRAPSPVRPVEQQIDEQRLRSLELANANAANNNAEGLTPEAIHLQAQQYILNGQLPPLGMGRQAASARQAIINEAARLAGVAGRSGSDLATGFARFRNSQHTLQTLDNQLGTIRGNESTALANAQQFLDRIHELYPPGSTRLGNMVRHGINEFLNDPTQAAYNAAYTTFLTEYAKVVAGSPSGSGVLSDSARREAMDMLSNATSPEAAERAVNQMRQDMANRVGALQGNIERGYGNLSAGRPASFAPNGDMLDDHGAVVPVSRTSRDEGPPVMGQAPPTPPAGGAPGAPSGGGPPVPGPDRMDATTVHMAPQNGSDVSLNTSLTQSVPDPALAGINEHVQGMLHSGASDAEIRQYVQDRGVPINQVPGFDATLAWRRAHPNYQGAYSVDLDKHLVPQSLTRSALTNFADSAPGAAAISAGNMVAGQQIPNIVGATGGDAELARAGMSEVRNRHPVASVVGDVGGGALAYSGMTGGARLGVNAAERLAPGVVSRLPAWVRAASTAGEAEAAAAPYSAEAASQSALAPTGTFAPRAIAADAGLGAYESPGNRLEGAAVGAATGAGFRGAINTGARAISPTGGTLAPAYEEGVAPTIGQRMGGIGNRVEQAFQSIPIVGGVQRGARTAAQDQWQLGGFNRALRNLPDDVQLPALAPDGSRMAPGTAPHSFAQDAFDKAYDRVHQRVRVVADDQLGQDMSDLEQQASLLSDSSSSHFNRIVNNSLFRRLQNGGGQLSGDDLQQTLSEIRRTARGLRSNPTGDRELAGQLDDLASAIHDNAARHSPPEAIQTLGNINRGYGMLVRIENAANRAGAGDPGEYTAKGLLNAERQQGGLRGRQFSAGNGLMTDYAQAGMRLGQTVADSGTPERQAIMGAGTLGGIGAASHFVSPYAAAPWIANTFSNLPGVKGAVNFALRPNNPVIRPYTDAIRAQIEARANLGSQVGLPAVVAAYQGGP